MDKILTVDLVNYSKTQDNGRLFHTCHWISCAKRTFLHWALWTIKNRATQRIQFCANPCHNNQRKREVVHDKIGVSEQRFCYPESRAFENRIFQFMKGKHYEVDWRILPSDAAWICEDLYGRSSQQIAYVCPCTESPFHVQHGKSEWGAERIPRLQADSQQDRKSVV